MRAKNSLLTVGALFLVAGLVFTGCETPWDDDDDVAAAGNSTISGNVKTYETGETLYARALDEVVTVTLSSTGQRAEADAEGYFTLTGVPSGVQELLIAFNGTTRAYVLTVEENCTVILSDLEVMADGLVLVGAVSVILNDAASSDSDDDGDDEEEVVVAPINLSTNLDQMQGSADIYAAIGYQDMVQTFTAGVSGDLVRVDVGVKKGDTPEFTLEVVTTDGSGIPTATVLGSVTVAAAGMNEYPAWSSFSFDPQVTLNAGTVYGINLSGAAMPTGGSWRGHTTATNDVYPGGEVTLINGVVTNGFDMVFRTYMAVPQ